MAELLPAARVEDPIHHNAGFAGFFVGAFVGAVGAVLAVAAGVITVATGGLALVAIVAVAALCAGTVGELVARATMRDGIHTGQLSEGSDNVYVNGKRLVLMANIVEPCWVPVLYPHGKQGVVEGSLTVIVNCRPASRMNDEILCGAYIADGSPNVFIGGPKGRINGTESSVATFILERFGAVAFATQFALYPGPGLVTLSGTAAFHADYSTYKTITEGIAGEIEGLTGQKVQSGYVGAGVEMAISLASGKLPGWFSASRAMNWNAFKTAATTAANTARTAAYSRYLNKPNSANWSYSRWLKAYEHLNKVRPGTTKLGALTKSLDDTHKFLEKVPILDALQTFSAAIRVHIDSGREQAAGGCDHSWYSAVQ